MDDPLVIQLTQRVLELQRLIGFVFSDPFGLQCHVCSVIDRALEDA
jgi:hypothetical protein